MNTFKNSFLFGTSTTISIPVYIIFIAVIVEYRIIEKRRRKLNIFVVFDGNVCAGTVYLI